MHIFNDPLEKIKKTINDELWIFKRDSCFELSLCKVGIHIKCILKMFFMLSSNPPDFMNLFETMVTLPCRTCESLAYNNTDKQTGQSSLDQQPSGSVKYNYFFF